MLKYKNYIANIEFDDENESFYGEVINTRDVITFQGKTAKELKKAFADSIEDYLEFCKERHEDPEKPFSGTFNLRLEPEDHRKAFINAKNSRISLNEWVVEAVKEKLHKTSY